MLVANFRRVHGMQATLNTLRGPIGEVKGQLVQPTERERVNINFYSRDRCIHPLADLVRGRSSILPQSMSLTVAWTGGQR
jgi:hypothetical protein